MPSTCGNWQDSIRWWFLRDFNHSIDIFRQDKFFRGIMKAWWDLKHNLVQSLPSCMEEWLCQPLIMNPLFLSEEGGMLGKRTRLKWADFDRGEAGSVRNWLYFSSSTIENKTQICRTIWGGNIMYTEIDRVFTMHSFQPSQSGLFWYGMFSSLNVLLGVRGYKNSHDCLYFDVLRSGRLHSIVMEDEVVSQGSMLPVRILWKNDKKWMLNPHPNDINNLSELWVYENKPIDKLLWDPNEWKWQSILPQGMLGKQIPFFQYSVKMGRELLRRRVVVTPVTCKFWNLGNVRHSWLNAYWKWLWAMEIPRKVVLFRWLLVHYGTPVKSWMKGHCHDLKCDNCGFPNETVHHVLWVCPIARAVWKRMLRILYPIYGKQVYTWGFVRWGRLAEEIQNYERDYVDFLLLSDGRHVLEVSYTTTIRCLEEDKVWSTISSLVVWVLWKARCKCVFQKVKQNAVELVKEIWLMLLHTLRGQYEAITSEPDVVVHKQQFREIWKKAEVFTSFGERIKWRYAPPTWLFPPPVLEHTYKRAFDT